MLTNTAIALLVGLILLCILQFANYLAEWQIKQLNRKIDIAKREAALLKRKAALKE